MTLDQQFDALSDKEALSERFERMPDIEALRFLDKALDRFNFSCGHDLALDALEQIADDVAPSMGFEDGRHVMGWDRTSSFDGARVTKLAADELRQLGRAA
jgi:hypothetical protein